MVGGFSFGLQRNGPFCLIGPQMVSGGYSEAYRWIASSLVAGGLGLSKQRKPLPLRLNLEQ